MTRTKWLLSGLATLGAALTLVAPAPVSAPAGPGGVLDAVKGLLRAIDSGDREYLARAIADRHHALTWSVDSKGNEVPAQGDDSAASFFDLGLDGRMVEAAGREAFIERALADLGSSQSKGRLVMSRLVSVQAACAAEQCSYAVIEFERIAASDNGEVKMPMRATALFRYESGAPSFKLMHWHASLAKAQTLVNGDDK